jgi:hypothetical protein
MKLDGSEAFGLRAHPSLYIFILSTRYESARLQGVYERD